MRRLNCWAELHQLLSTADFHLCLQFKLFGRVSAVIILVVPLSRSASQSNSFSKELSWFGAMAMIAVVSCLSAFTAGPPPVTLIALFRCVTWMDVLFHYWNRCSLINKWTATKDPEDKRSWSLCTITYYNVHFHQLKITTLLCIASCV